DRRPETGDRRPETGDRRPETGDRRPEFQNGRLKIKMKVNVFRAICTSFLFRSPFFRLPTLTPAPE
ncbi:MAG: hypothetical protein AAF632_28275, partial [Bacteroidota bacterium]